MITVFTPTFNRGNLLPRLYDSLKRQTSKEFEWLIVDDGSTDETRNLVENFIVKANEFQIRYYYKQNGGKHTAINLGVAKTLNEWFFIVDSDDFLKDDAVETIEKWIRTVNDECIAGLAGTCITMDGKTIGGNVKFNGLEYVDASNLERKKYGLSGDKAEIYRTEVLKRFPFPVFEGETFITEVCVWNEIARRGYKIRWYDYPLKICEYRNDGLTYQIDHEGLMLRNFEGYKYSMKYIMYSCKGVEKIRTIKSFITSFKTKGIDIKELSETLQIPYAYLCMIDWASKVKNTISRMWKYQKG